MSGIQQTNNEGRNIFCRSRSNECFKGSVSSNQLIKHHVLDQSGTEPELTPTWICPGGYKQICILHSVTTRKSEAIFPQMRGQLNWKWVDKAGTGGGREVGRWVGEVPVSWSGKTSIRAKIFSRNLPQSVQTEEYKWYRGTGKVRLPPYKGQKRTFLSVLILVLPRKEKAFSFGLFTIS